MGRGVTEMLFAAVLFAGAGAFFATPAAHAQNATRAPSAARTRGPVYCITCKNPAATYRCEVTGVDPAFADALKLYCVIRMSKQGHHASCSASEARHCKGALKVFAYKGPPINKELEALQRKMAEENKKFPEPNPNPNTGNKTLLGLTKGMFNASKRGIKNTRERLSHNGSKAPPQTPMAESAPPPPQPQAHAQSTHSTRRSQAAVSTQPAASESFLHRSYRCLRSLFRHCSSDNETASE